MYSPSRLLIPAEERSLLSALTIQVDWRETSSEAVEPRALHSSTAGDGDTWAFLTAREHCRGELRASGKAHKAAVMLVAWQRNTGFI